MTQIQAPIISGEFQMPTSLLDRSSSPLLRRCKSKSNSVLIRLFTQLSHAVQYLRDSVEFYLQLLRKKENDDSFRCK